MPSADQEDTVFKYIGSELQGWVSFGKGRKEQGNLDEKAVDWRIRLWEDWDGLGGMVGRWLEGILNFGMGLKARG